ncbi:WD40-repeat-containing domain protein [Lineolata rhizophorae]|uniref:WD40-repeat-containing domain protein n=1 Tax=Lineolata rhizophorae TaxID=578093 RepID=A0A6A6NRJ5_9PEZI|nr:WD40-repeat-containing domain protein [Lineolata rhizophorae]
MNTRKVIDESSGPVALSASFNSNNILFSVALENGFQIYNTQKCEVVSARRLRGGIGNTQILDTTNFIALVGGGKQPHFPENKVIIWDEKSQTAAITMEFRTEVKRVCLSKDHIVVVLLNSVNLYRFAKPPSKITMFETSNNPFGLCCLGKRVVAFPGRTPGHVQIVELATKNVSIVPAHSLPLRALDLSRDGEFLATASEKGTLIRIWSVASGTRLAEFRRGVDPAAIFSVAISPSNAFLAVTSDKSTLHIFELVPQPAPAPAPSSIRSPHHRSHSHSLTPSPARGEAPNGGTPPPQPAPSVFSATSSHRPSPPPPSAAQPAEPPPHKWGFLSKLPFAPRVFSDTYSACSCAFAPGDEPPHLSLGPGGVAGGGAGGTAADAYLRSPSASAPIPGVPGGRPGKGIIGWVEQKRRCGGGAGEGVGRGRGGREESDWEVEDALVVLGAGSDARWEMFRVARGGEGGTGGWVVWREGWRRYLED